MEIDIDIKYCPACGKEIDSTEHFRIDKKKQYPFDVVICEEKNIVLEVEVIQRR
jgi:hypothetical protein